MLIALTGTLGGGKSTVLRFFDLFGVNTISADEIVHELLETPKVRDQIQKYFGRKVFTPSGKIDRKKLAARVFSNKDEKRYLESILHPLVFQTIFDKYSQNPKAITVAEVPLLFETATEDHFNKVIVVKTPIQVVKKRLQQRGMSHEDIEARMKHQIDLETKLAKADFIIDNSGSLSETKKQVEDLVKILNAQNRSS